MPVLFPHQEGASCWDSPGTPVKKLLSSDPVGGMPVKVGDCKNDNFIRIDSIE
jgi:hypothetical protein